MTTVELLTPFGAPERAVELASSGLWRKQILPYTTIDYSDRTGRTRKIRFDEKYARDLIEAFKSKAYSQVPFQLADGDNNHNNDPRNTGGELVGVELSADGSGLDGIFRLWGQGEQVVASNQRLGVSARILENLQQPDGRHFPRALQHVLGTVDPQTVSEHPWQKVELSNGTAGERVDLSDQQYGRGAVPGTDETKTEVLELTASTKERLLALLEEDEALDDLAKELEKQGFKFDDQEDEDEDESDNEDGGDEEAGSDTGGGRTDLSNSGDSDVLELARAQLDSQGAQILELTNQLNSQRVQTEVDHWGREGLAPAVIEAARPLLQVPTGAVELSNGTGTQVDPGETVRELLTTVVDLARSGQLLIDPDDELGSLTGSNAQQAERDALDSDFEQYFK